MTRAVQELDRLYTEDEAGEALGIKPRSLRTERVAGRIGYKRVAGKIMYRRRDLVEWMNQGEEPCRDEIEDRTSLPSRGAKTIISLGPKTDGAGDAAQVRAISQKLKGCSKTSSAADQGDQGRVIQGSFRS